MADGIGIELIAVDTSIGNDEIAPGVTTKMQSRDEQERGDRQVVYRVTRQYYDGAQYDKENEDLAVRAGYTSRGLRLPEHLRKHAYSSHLQEAVDVLADMLAEGISFDGEHADLLNQWWMESNLEERVDDWFREALMQGDSYAVPEYDIATEKMSVDLWEAESIWPVYQQNNWRVLERYWKFQMAVDDQGNELEEKRLFILLETSVPADLSIPDDEIDTLDVDFPPSTVVKQLVEYVYRDGKLFDTIPHAKSFFPIVHGRGDTRHRLRSMFGDSLITRKVRGSADRYNALGQLGFRVARQNSFATIAVVGDAASLGGGSRDESIAKDVADVLRFPGGTNVSSIVLPTDPQMIEYQQSLLEKNLYREFGLTKTDLSDFGGLGTVSGYAIEILNRKERATHQRIRNNALAALKGLANRMLDVYAVATADTEWWNVDPEEVFPNREGIQIVIGSGDIVDTVSDRDDFAAGIVSRAFVLRRKGLPAKEIKKIDGEILAEKQAMASIETQQQQQVLAQQSESALELARLNAENQEKVAAAQAAATPAPASPSSSGSASTTTTSTRQTGSTASS